MISHYIKTVGIRRQILSEPFASAERVFNESSLNDSKIEVFSLRGKYTEHVKKGESVIVEGKLEEIYFLNHRNPENLSRYRIVVGQADDYFTVD